MQTKLRQKLVFDPGGCSGRLRGCPFLGGRLALLRGGFVWNAEIVFVARACFVERGTVLQFEEQAIWHAVRY